MYAGITLLIVNMILAGTTDFGSTLALTSSFFALILFSAICGTVALWILSRTVWSLPEKNSWRNRLIAGIAGALILAAVPVFAIILPDTKLVTIYPWPVLAVAVIMLAAIIPIRWRMK
ncbi:MAG: hypothetical protein LBL85_05390 [Methanocalculaceae archaeon]|nr:hypothetical protein [Methanocalculaceae archaeon]